MEIKNIAMLIKVYFFIIRPRGCLVAAISSAVSFLMVVPNIQQFSFELPILGALVLFFTCAVGMVVNDIADYKIDRINQMKRPIPLGVLTIKAAITYSIVLFFMGLICAFYLGFAGNALTTSLVYYLIMSLVLLLYNLSLKKIVFVSNILVASCAFACFIHGELILYSHLSIKMTIMGVMAFCLTLSREILKDIVDIEGDATENISTIPIIYGLDYAIKISSAIMMAGVFVVIISIFFLNFTFVTNIILILFALVLFFYCLKVIINKKLKDINELIVNSMNIYLLIVLVFLADILIFKRYLTGD